MNKSVETETKGKQTLETCILPKVKSKDTKKISSERFFFVYLIAVIYGNQEIKNAISKQAKYWTDKNHIGFKPQKKENEMKEKIDDSQNISMLKVKSEQKQNKYTTKE